jgi:hypothetical protein
VIVEAEDLEDLAFGHEQYGTAVDDDPYQLAYEVAALSPAKRVIFDEELEFIENSVS